MTREYSFVSLRSEDPERSLSPDELYADMSACFSAQVHARCKELGITFTELAHRCGIKPPTLSEKLNGRNLTLKSMAAMAVALGCSISGPNLVPLPSLIEDEGDDSSASAPSGEPASSAEG